MKIIVLVIGIATGVLGCATREVRDDQLSRARGGKLQLTRECPGFRLVPSRRDHREPWAGIRELMVAYRRA